jgi:hypothetical protein
MFIKEQINMIENWPPNSCDLSPIEQLWGIIKRKIADRQPKSLYELRFIIIDEYNKIQLTVINKLIAGIPKRMQLCLSNNGKQIGHLLRNLSNSEQISINLKSTDVPGGQTEQHDKNREPPSILPDEENISEISTQIRNSVEESCNYDEAPPVIKIKEINSKYVGQKIQIIGIITNLKKRDTEFGNRRCFISDLPSIEASAPLPRTIPALYNSEIIPDLPCGTTVRISAAVIQLPETRGPARKLVYELSLKIFRMEAIAFGSWLSSQS